MTILTFLSHTADQSYNLLNERPFDYYANINYASNDTKYGTYSIQFQTITLNQSVQRKGGLGFQDNQLG